MAGEGLERAIDDRLLVFILARRCALALDSLGGGCRNGRDSLRAATVRECSTGVYTPLRSWLGMLLGMLLGFLRQPRGHPLETHTVR